MASEYGLALLDKVQRDFAKYYANDSKIKKLTKKIANNSQNYEDINEYAIRVGKLASKALTNHVNSKDLNYISRDLAEDVIKPILTTDYELISNAVWVIQDNMNKASNISLQPQIADLDTNRIDGLINKISSYETLDQGEYLLKEPVVNYSQAVVDDSIRKNAKVQAKAGLTPKIRRVAESGACKWCRALEGVYEPQDAPDNIYKRHEFCRCQVTYENGKERQDVWSKTKWEAEEEKEQKARIQELIENEKNNNRRYIAEDGHEIIDKPTYNKLTKDFIKSGGKILQDEEAQEHLRLVGASATYISGAKTILFKPDPTISDVLEEIYHYNQDKKNVFSNCNATEMFLRREIEAQEYLLSQAKKYKIPLEQLQVTKINLEMYKKLLAEYLREKR